MSRSPLALKICGLTDPAQALAIAALGVDAIGVIGVPGSPRYLPERERRELFSALQRHHPAVLRVWVVADLEDGAIAAGLSGPGRPTVVQLHGSETPEHCLLLRRHHPTLQWWKALRIRHPADLDRLILYADAVDGLLLDAWSPDQLGGTGHRLDLHWLDTLQDRLPAGMPWWLAGGISAEWVPELRQRVQPHGLDASSRLETAPGVKDLQRVKHLIDAIRPGAG